MSVIDDYLATQDEPIRRELQKVRRLIVEAVPDSREVISYGMPGFKYHGKYLGGFNAFSNHLSLFPTAGPVEAYKMQLADYTATKGTIQFTLDHPLPDQLIKNLYQHRANIIDRAQASPDTARQG